MILNRFTSTHFITKLCQAESKFKVVTQRKREGLGGWSILGKCDHAEKEVCAP